jgi:hypothetical protein
MSNEKTFDIEETVIDLYSIAIRNAANILALRAVLEAYIEIVAPELAEKLQEQLQVAYKDAYENEVYKNKIMLAFANDAICDLLKGGQENGK